MIFLFIGYFFEGKFGLKRILRVRESVCVSEREREREKEEQHSIQINKNLFYFFIFYRIVDFLLYSITFLFFVFVFLCIGL